MPGTLDSSGIVRPGSINSPTLQVYTVYRGAERIPLHYGVNTDMIGELLEQLKSDSSSVLHMHSGFLPILWP